MVGGVFLASCETSKVLVTAVYLALVVCPGISLSALQISLIFCEIGSTLPL